MRLQTIKISEGKVALSKHINESVVDDYIFSEVDGKIRKNNPIAKWHGRKILASTFFIDHTIPMWEDEEKLFTEKELRKAFYAGEMHCATEGKVYSRTIGIDDFIKSLKCQLTHFDFEWIVDEECPIAIQQYKVLKTIVDETGQTRCYATASKNPKLCFHCGCELNSNQECDYCLGE